MTRKIFTQLALASGFVISSLYISGCIDEHSVDIKAEDMSANFIARMYQGADMGYVRATLYNTNSRSELFNQPDSIQLSHGEEFYSFVNGDRKWMEPNVFLFASYTSDYNALRAGDTVEIQFDRANENNITSSIVLPNYPTINSPSTGSTFDKGDDIPLLWDVTPADNDTLYVSAKLDCSSLDDENSDDNSGDYTSEDARDLRDTGSETLNLDSLFYSVKIADDIDSCRLRLELARLVTNSVSNDGYHSGTFKAYMYVTQTHTIML